MKKLHFLILFLLGFSFLNAQCTVNDATDCECEDSTQVDCDLLPDIQVSWFGLIDVSVSASIKLMAPVISFLPDSLIKAAKFNAVVVLPTPPF